MSKCDVPGAPHTTSGVCGLVTTVGQVSPADDNPFCESRADMKELEDELSSGAALTAPIHEIERLLESRGRELLRAMMQAHLDLRSEQQCEAEACGADGVAQASFDDVDPEQLLILSFDGKGIARPLDHPREASCKAAEATLARMHRRRAKREQPHRKRMAEVAAVYSLKASPRTITDVLHGLGGNRDTDRPRPVNMRVWTTVEHGPEQVIEDAFAEALRRDPERHRRWVVLVDGNRDQVRRIQQAAGAAGGEITIVLDLVHVIEHLWRAAYALHAESTREAENWVECHLQRLLQGHSGGEIARRLRLMGKTHALDPIAAKPVLEAASFLEKNTRWLHYDRALADGLPIGDFDDDWQFHLAREHERTRASRYGDNAIVPAADMRGYFAEVERAAIVKALEAEDQNQTRAARRLGLSRRALIYKMEKYGLKPLPGHSETRQ